MKDWVKKLTELQGPVRQYQNVLTYMQVKSQAENWGRIRQKKKSEEKVVKIFLNVKIILM